MEKAQEVIRGAEAKLRDLISEALQDQRYGDVREVAQLADRVAHLLSSRELESANAAGPLDNKSATHPTRPQTSSKKRVRRRKGTASAQSPKRTYPRFVRDGHRLVKVGWSKKNRQEYQHRVPRSALQAFAEHLTAHIEGGRVFDIEGLLPVHDSAGQEIPAYQVYVIVAWMRDAGIVERKGRDGYLVEDPSSLFSQFDALWSGLPAK